jgi:hypothetical protein
MYGGPQQGGPFNYYTQAVPWNDYVIHQPRYISVSSDTGALMARIEEMCKEMEVLKSKVEKLENLVVAGAFAPGGILSTQAEMEFNNLLGDYIQNDAGKALKESVEVEIQEEEVKQKAPNTSKASKRRVRRKRRNGRKNR